MWYNIETMGTQHQSWVELPVCLLWADTNNFPGFQFLGKTDSLSASSPIWVAAQGLSRPPFVICLGQMHLKNARQAMQCLHCPVCCCASPTSSACHPQSQGLRQGPQLGAHKGFQKCLLQALSWLWQTCSCTAAKGCYLPAQSYSFANSKVDHFDFCFTFTMLPPASIILGLPPPSGAPTTNFPGVVSLGVCVAPPFLTHPLFQLPDTLLLFFSWPLEATPSFPSFLFSASWCAGSCPAASEF